MLQTKNAWLWLAIVSQIGPVAEAFSAALLLSTQTGLQRSVVSSARRDSHAILSPSSHVEGYNRHALNYLGERRKTFCYAIESSSQDEDVEINISDPPAPSQNRLDQLLSQLTSAFPLFVLFSAILGYAKPSTLTWVNKGSLISVLLASIMCGTGLTLRPEDFVRVREQWKMVPLGVLAQFSIMPLTAWAVGRTLLLSRPEIGPSLFLGLCLVGCSPGGTASNLVTLIAGADVALSVVLTSCSTLLAVVATPTLVKLLVGGTIQVPGWTLCVATGKVVLGPVLLGMFLNQKAPDLAAWLSRFTPLASVLLVSAICGGVVAQNASLTSQAALVGPVVATAVLLLHTIGFALGYAVPRWVARAPERTARTVSIEVGMQNSALAVVLAKSMGAPILACLPGALSATAHSCLGSMLAAFWRMWGKDDEEEQE